jgi:hypothetical protein
LETVLIGDYRSNHSPGDQTPPMIDFFNDKIRSLKSGSNSPEHQRVSENSVIEVVQLVGDFFRTTADFMYGDLSGKRTTTWRLQ